MHILVVSTYELGHQPLMAATAAAALANAGHTVTCTDLSVERLDPGAVDAADAIAFAVPMHTATRLALAAARSARDHRPGVPICLYGLYAMAGAQALDAIGGGAALAGEYLDDLLRWAASPTAASEKGTGAATVPKVSLEPAPAVQPRRDLLPALERYATLAIGDEKRLAGYVEASRGCTQGCRHCPVPTVYRGRLRPVDPEVVLADVDELVGMGARHITFGDPDFLCSPPHARRVIEAFARRHEGISFDVTTKVSHILANADVWPSLVDAGLLFVTTAIECLDDSILALLDKGHTAEDAGHAVSLLGSHGIDTRPSFLPFTPWTTAAGVADILDFVLDHDMADVVEAVQYSLRLLIPPGSLMLDLAEMVPHLDAYDPERLTWDWHAADSRADELCASIAEVAEAAAAAGEAAVTTFRTVYGLVAAAAGRDPARAESAGNGPRVARPHLTEAWFCCAEPTRGQLAPVELSPTQCT